MKKLNLFIFLFFVASLIRLDGGENHTLPYQTTSAPFFKSRIETTYSTGQFIGIKRSYSELGLFLPVFSNDALTSFFDFRGYKLNNDKWGLSSGIGLRKCLDNNDLIGANIYYDYLEGDFHKSFNRVGLGLELLGECMDFRINTYLPIGLQKHFSETVKYIHYIGGYRATCRENQFAIGRGIDAEIGGRFCCLNDFAVYGAIGPYYYSSNRKNSYFGAQARVELSYQSLVSIQIRSS